MAQPNRNQSSRTQPSAPRRLLTDWTTSAGVDGSGLLALVLGGATAEGIHLATLGYETFVLHPDGAAAETAEPAAHVHHVAADPAGLPDEWSRRFDLVVALHVTPMADLVADAGLLVVVAVDPIAVPDRLTELLRESIEDPEQPDVTITRSVLARLT